MKNISDSLQQKKRMKNKKNIAKIIEKSITK